MNKYKYYDKNENELSQKFLKDFYKKSKLLIISGLTNTGKETLARNLDKNGNYGTISVNEALHSFDAFSNKIGLVHADSIGIAKCILNEVYSDLELSNAINHIHIEKKTNKYILDIQ